MKKTNNKGFSLVELIIVIAIMAVLIGVLAPQFIKYVEKSKESKDITNLDSCVESVKIYYADKDWPNSGVVKITGAKNANFTADDGGSALSDSGSTKSKVTGNWTTSLVATVKSTGEVTYAGEADYYKASDDAAAGYVAK